MPMRSTPQPGYPEPPNEAGRMQALRDYAVLDSEAEQSFDDLTRIASLVCDTPMSLITLVDGQRVWFKSRQGIDGTEAPRGVAFCSHAILEPSDLMVVPDLREDARFAANPLVQDAPHIRFYAGAPLVTPQGQALGTLCVLDSRPREFDAAQKEVLAALSRQAILLLELRRALATTTACSLTDPLTGVGNRRAFDARLAEEWGRLGRVQRPLAIVLADVDHFKRYNDEFGHQTGDAVLCRLAAVIGRSRRGSDLLVRWGGEEFAVLAPETDLTGALDLAERVRADVEQAAWPGRPVTVSIGVAAVVPAPDRNCNGLVARADEALYLAKRLGRNRVHAGLAALDTQFTPL